MKTAEAANCFELASKIDGPLKEQLGTVDYLVLGGIATAGLVHPETQIDVAGEALTPPSDINLPTVRANGTQRDIDVLVLTSDQEAVEKAHQTVDLLLGRELEVSVFGLRRVSYLNQYYRRLLTEFTSERIEIKGGDIGLVLGPLRQRLNRDLFEPWRVDTVYGEIPVFHPIGQMLNYLTRSVTGLRPKDRQKVIEMGDKIMAEPDLAAEHERFDDWYGFAEQIHRLPDESLAAISGDRLEAVMTRGKRALLAALERHPKLVEWGQKGWIQEVLAKKFVKSNGSK